MFRPGLAWKPRLWPGFWRLWLSKSAGRARAVNDGWLWLGFGPSRGPGVKFITNQIYWVPERHTVPTTWIECAWVGMFKWYHTLTIFMHTVVWWWCIRPWKRYWNTLMMSNDCQQMKTNINQRDIPCFSYQIHVMHWFSYSFVCMHLAYVHLTSASLLSVSTWCSQFSAI